MEFTKNEEYPWLKDGLDKKQTNNSCIGQQKHSQSFNLKECVQ